MCYRLNSRQLFSIIALLKALTILSAFMLSMHTSSVFAQEKTNGTGLGNENPESSTWFTAKNLLDNLQIQGFASQAFIATSDNDVFGNTDEGGSFGFTELGLNALLRPLPRLQLSGQMLSRRAGKDNNGTPRLDFAFFDYTIYSHETNQFGIRFGRLKNPFGFYNDTRDVPFTRPSILLPQSIYFDRTRNVGLSADSIQFYGETSNAKWGDFTVQFGITRPIVDDRDTEISLLGPNLTGNLSPDVSLIGRGLYETPNKRFRFAVSGVWFNANYKPGVNDPISVSPGSIQFSPIYISAQYNTERWSLTSEYALRKFRYSNFEDSRLDSQDFFGESFYFQGEYRFSHKWEALIRYDMLFTDRSDRDGSEFAAATKIPAHTRFAKDLTVGLRWNITPRIMARLEYHRINGTAWLAPLDNPDAFDTTKNWNLFAAQLSFRF
ncbi:hypothetical protein SAMN05421690_10669 [Nitrosomonas sp. Nm51]|uniref:OprO/OprP family phosphate-selective porin n=1 Tax=Nitrosomonas sp. Nm51 TaxID=133720 RepID=UPI0008AAF64B|nr:OprO/OprP family phosphate-selective porin [Nitrosomonas sp. Nm51]SER75263.1 hypothetical protein SAMN05421690_10669 [Nitrosomonas sp. Nm51]